MTSRTSNIPISSKNEYKNVLQENLFNNLNNKTEITWAAGLEMEATYVLNPLSKGQDFKDGLKQFYLLDFKKIINHIDEKYNNDKKYPYLYEAEQSGRACGPNGNKKYIIKPDPPSSMLEIATTVPYKDKNNIYESASSLVNYPHKLMDIQKKALRDMNIFYKKEKLYKNKIYRSIVPYPFAMSDRLKNADIILGDKKDTKKKCNYTGSYHFTFTLPFYNLGYNKKMYSEQYKRYINQFQWIEPFIVALYTTADMRTIGSKTIYSRASYRILLSGWGQPAGSDVRKFDNGLTRKVNIPLYWREGMNYPGMDKLKKYCANPKGKYDPKYVDPNRDLFDMGGDFRTPSGTHDDPWSKRDIFKGKNYGVEMRILDYFPPKHMTSLIRFMVFLVQNSRDIENKIYVYEDKDWIETMHSVFKDGWRAKITDNFINKLEKVLELKFHKKPKRLDAFWDILLKKIYKKNYNGFYVSQLLPHYYDNNRKINIKSTKPPPLEKRNPNKESIDFAILLKINDSDLLKKKIIKTFQSLPVNKKTKLETIEKHYKKHMPPAWKNNLKDLIYFFKERDCLTINENKDAFIDTIKINKKQNDNIKKVIHNYIDEIIKIWPELLEDFTNIQ